MQTPRVRQGSSTVVLLDDPPRRGARLAHGESTIADVGLVVAAGVALGSSACTRTFSARWCSPTRWPNRPRRCATPRSSDRHRRHGAERAARGRLAGQPAPPQALPAVQRGVVHRGVARSAALPRPARAQVDRVGRPRRRGRSTSSTIRATATCPRASSTPRPSTWSACGTTRSAAPSATCTATSSRSTRTAGVAARRSARCRCSAATPTSCSTSATCSRPEMQGMTLVVRRPGQAFEFEWNFRDRE
jgi:hypothetical protein